MAPESRDPGAKPPPQPPPNLFYNLDLNNRDHFPPLASQSDNQEVFKLERKLQEALGIESLQSVADLLREENNENGIQLRYVRNYLRNNPYKFNKDDRDKLFALLHNSEARQERMQMGLDNCTHQLTLVGNQVGVITRDIGKINIRVEETERKAGIKPTEDTAVESTMLSLNWLEDKTADQNYFGLKANHKVAHTYPQGTSAAQMIFGSGSRPNTQVPPPGFGSSTSNSQPINFSYASTVSMPPPAAANGNAQPPTTADNKAQGQGLAQPTSNQGQAQPASSETMPIVYYRGGARWKKMPTPYIQDLIEKIHTDEMLTAALSGIDKNPPPVKVGGKKASPQEMEVFKERQRELLLKLSETGGEFYALLQKGKGGEGRLSRWLKSKCRDIMKDNSYQINPASRRLVDFVDGELISPELNWFLDTNEKDGFENDLMNYDMSSIPADKLDVAELILYHQHKLVVGQFLMSDWREFDNWYGLQCRPAWIKLLLAQILEEKFGVTNGDFTELGVIEITPMLNQFCARFPHTLVVTVRNRALAKVLVEKYNEKLKQKTSKERKELKLRCTYFLPDEMRDWVLKSEQKMVQLRKANTIQGRRKTNFCYRYGGVEGLTELNLYMSTDNAEFEKVDTSMIKTPYISNKNKYRGDPHSAPMALHHKRQLLQYRSNLDDPSNANSRRRKPKELTEEEINKAMEAANSARQEAAAAAKKGASGPAPKINTAGASILAIPTSNSFNPLFGQRSASASRSASITSVTELISGGGKHNRSPEKEDEENKKANLDDDSDMSGKIEKDFETSILRINSCSTDEDEFEFQDAIDTFQDPKSEDIEPEMNKKETRKPSIFENSDVVDFNLNDDNKYVSTDNADSHSDDKVGGGNKTASVDFSVSDNDVGIENAYDKDDCSKKGDGVFLPGVVLTSVDNVEDDCLTNTVNRVNPVSTVNEETVMVVTDMNTNGDKTVETVKTTDSTETQLLTPNASREGEGHKTVSPLKSRHESPRAKFVFDTEASGRSIVLVDMNKEWLRTVWQFWIDASKENFYEIDDYTVMAETKDKGATLHLSVRMKAKKEKEKSSRVTVRQESATKLRFEGKRNATGTKNLIGLILAPSFWAPIMSLESDPDISIVGNRQEENDQRCRVCIRTDGDTVVCTCCYINIHKSCATNGACKESCKWIEVKIHSNDRKELEIVNMNQSSMYRRMAAALRQGVKKIPRSRWKKQNEEEFGEIQEKNKLVPEKTPKPVVTTEVKSLAAAVNDAVGTFEAKAIVAKDKTMEKFIGVRKKPVKESPKSPDPALTPTQIAEMTMEKLCEEERIETEIETNVKQALRKTVCKDNLDPKGSWLRAVSTLIVDDGDYTFSSDIKRFAKTLVEGIPVMSDTGVWVAQMFGGDNERFLNFLRTNVTPDITIDLNDPKGAMLCSATAKQISRVINIHTAETLTQNLQPMVFAGGLDSMKRRHLDVLFHRNRFWAMIDMTEEQKQLLEDVSGVQGPSQSQQGKYRIHKVKGPTLPMKGKNAASKAKKDEKRRRDEKAKTEKDIKMDAMEESMDLLRVDCANLREKLRNMEDLTRAQRKYMMSLEIRFSDLCSVCKAKTPETAFTSSERASIMNIVKMLEDQQKTLDALTKSAGINNNTGVDTNTSSSGQETL